MSVTTVKMKKTELVEGEDGKTYRKLPNSEAANYAEPIRGQIGDGEKVKYAWYEEVKQTT